MRKDGTHIFPEEEIVSRVFTDGASQQLQASSGFESRERRRSAKKGNNSHGRTGERPVAT